MAAKTAKRSEAIKEDVARVRITARTGRLPLVPDDVKWINQHTKIDVPGVALVFEDGVCELHPVHDADTIKLFREWIADGRDPRIVEQGVFEIAADDLVAPFAKWNVTTEAKILELVETLGLDPEHCLRYELQRGDDARKKLVSALEAKVDEPPADDPLSEPSL